MSWTNPKTWVATVMVTAAELNAHLRDNLLALRDHGHGGEDAGGDQTLGPLTYEDFTDAAAPAAPGAGKTRRYSVSGVPHFRAGAAGADSIEAETTVAGLDLADHSARHDSGGADVMAVDAAAGTPSLRSLGTSATTAAPGTVDAADGVGSVRTLGLTGQSAAKGTTFADHNARHEPGGADPMAVDAAAATGSLRTLGAGAAQAAGGTHVHAATGVSVLDRIVATTTVVSTTTETDLYRKAISAGSLGATGGLRLTAIGDSRSFGAARTMTWRLKFGATTLFDTSTLTIPDSTNRYGWTLELVIFNSASGAQRARGTFRLKGSPNDTWVSSSIAVDLLGYATAAEDTTAAKDLAITAQPSTNSANFDARIELALLEQLA